jgi:hypothetical protein
MSYNDTDHRAILIGTNAAARCAAAGLRIANPATDDKIMVDCAQGRAPTRVVAEQVRLGHMLCKSGWLRP